MPPSSATNTVVLEPWCQTAASVRNFPAPGVAQELQFAADDVRRRWSAPVHVREAQHAHVAVLATDQQLIGAQQRRPAGAEVDVLSVVFFLGRRCELLQQVQGGEAQLEL